MNTKNGDKTTVPWLIFFNTVGADVPTWLTQPKYISESSSEEKTFPKENSATRKIHDIYWIDFY